MNKLFKFNLRARRCDENTDDYSFGVIIKKTNSDFSFDFVDNKGEFIKFINLNEWRISSINMQPYYSRQIIYFGYSDPTGSRHILESGGRTLPVNDDVEKIDFVASALLEILLQHFHRISCFESIFQVEEIKEKLIKENRRKDALKFNHKYYSVF